MESTDVYKKITGEIKTRWKNVKTEDENENDTITALILGIMRIESRGEMENNYLSIHEAIVSPEHYDIETKRSERLFKLGKEYTPKLEITIYNADYNPYSNDLEAVGWGFNTLISTCYIFPKGCVGDIRVLVL